MSDLQQQHEKAKNAFEKACAVLETARREYRDGPEKKYAEVKKNSQNLQQAILEQEQAGVAAKKALANALQESNGAITSEAKDALSCRRNSDDLLDQFKAMKAELEVAETDVHIAASKAASTYAGAYESASRCWAELNLITALLDCGERLARAMVVEPRGHMLYPIGASFAGGTQASYRDITIAALEQLSKNFRDENRPYVAAIGAFDLGALSASDVLTPGAMKVAQERAGRVQSLMRR